MQPENLAKAPRCGAKTKNGTVCQAPAVKGRDRCRMHGGTNAGPPKGNKNAWRHGNRSSEAEEQLRVLRSTDRNLRLLVKLRNGAKLKRSDQDWLFEIGFGLSQKYEAID